MEAVTLVRIVGTALGLLGLYLAYRVGRKRFVPLGTEETVAVGHIRLSPATLWKLLAFAAIVVIPALVMTVANYHTFTGIHEVEACGRCHVMRPMITDMKDPASQTLAARHFRNGWIPQDQCYSCHSDYGMAGNMAAKAEGFRHLARYTTGTYREPIAFRGRFDNANCLKCHRGTPRFEAVKSHQTVRGHLDESGILCLNCHGNPHPTRAARTPGSPDYARLQELEK
jgi:nitrate/TMAO reductase-like tetraheme cytochrome c subunit